MNTTISISSNNFGPNQNKEKFIPKIIGCLKNNKSVPVYGDGTNIRDWIYVNDHCKLIDIIYNKSTSGNTYNIGGENELTNLKLIDYICKILNDNIEYNYDKKINFINDRNGHDKRYSLNIDKIKNDFNWKSNTHFINNLTNIIYKS